MGKELANYPDLLSYLEMLDRRGVVPSPQAKGFSLKEYWDREVEEEEASPIRSANGAWGWTDGWDTGIPFIDHQHQSFVEYVNSLHQAVVAGNRAKVKQLVPQVLDLVRRHFELEERLMELARFPSHESHVVLHQAFGEIVQVTCDSLLEGERRSLGLLKELRIKLIRHMVEEDQKYAPWLKQRLGNRWLDDLWHVLIR